jgi:hypothetical protein
MNEKPKQLSVVHPTKHILFVQCPSDTLVLPSHTGTLFTLTGLSS